MIVPILDEEAIMPALIRRLAALRQDGCEILIVDGGSRDGGPEIARANGYPVMTTAPGRARQMNAGAKAARGDILLFLHADTALPADALACVRAVLDSDAAEWGRFDVHIESSARVLRAVASLMNWRSRFTGISTGDQAIFVRRDVFDSIGGFPDQPLMEDIEISKRLRRRSWPRRVASRAVTSGRRWEQRGVWRTILLMWRLRLAYWCGVPAATLAERYR